MSLLSCVESNVLILFIRSVPKLFIKRSVPSLFIHRIVPVLFIHRRLREEATQSSVTIYSQASTIECFESDGHSETCIMIGDGR